MVRCLQNSYWILSQDFSIEAFRKELIDYKVSKGKIRFPLDKPIPLNLVRKMVKYRVKENSEKSNTFKNSFKQCQSDFLPFAEHQIMLFLEDLPPNLSHFNRDRVKSVGSENIYPNMSIRNLTKMGRRIRIRAPIPASLIS